MEVSARIATRGDLSTLVEFYRHLEIEQGALRQLWPVADGLHEPVERSLDAAIEDGTTMIVVGTLDSEPLGFALATTDDLLDQAGGEQIGTVRLIFTLDEARGVGIGAAMLETVLTELRGRGLRLFDARVSPGHRNAKNFFEGHGFSARLILMHHADAKGDDA